MTRVVVTGLGAITPLGLDAASSFDAALQARSAVRPMAPERCTGLSGMLTAPAADPEPLLDRKYAGQDRATQFALVAASQAWDASGCEPSPADGDRFGVYVGIGFGGASTLDAMFARHHAALHGSERERRGATVVHPLLVPRMMSNAAAAQVSMRYGLRGMANTYSIACASSAVAAGEAMRAIRHGHLDAAVVIGTEAMLTPGSMVAWNALRVMARPDPERPETSCRPFSVDRSGFVLGEGAAALVLESETRARRRGAAVLAELAGYGCSSDALHLTAPSVVGQVAAMRQALQEAGLEPGAIDYVNAHGTATDAGDVVESESIAEVFGASAVPVSSTKAVHGHLIGAAGALELVLAILAMREGAIPPTAHLEHPDPRCALDHVPLQARRGCAIDAVLSNSFGFGGSNACLVARRAAA